MINEIILVTPEQTNDLKSEIESLEAFTKQLQITDAETFEVVVRAMDKGDALQKRIIGMWEKSKKAAKATHQQICDDEKEMLLPVKTIMNILRPKKYKFEQDQEQKRLEAERKQQALVDKQAEKDAAKAEKKGDTTTAEVIRESAPVVRVESSVPKVSGMRKTPARWVGEVFDEKAIPAKLYRQFSSINQSKVNAFAKLNRKSEPVPGIRFYDASAVAGE